MTAFIKTGGAFKKLEKIFLKNSDGTWRGVVSAYLKDSLGTWRLFFGAEYLKPQISTEPNFTSNDAFGSFDQGSTITLTRGTWTNNPTSYSLSIEGSLDGTNWTTFATGSGTTVTYLITLDNATHPSYSFRGKVIATNAFGPSSPFYTIAYDSTITLDIAATVTSPTANGATFSWTVSPSGTLYRRSQEIIFYDDASPGTAAYTQALTSTAGSAVVSNPALLAGHTYTAYVVIVSYDTTESVNLSNALNFTTADNRPVGTDDTVTFSRDSESSYNYSVTSTGTWTNTPTSYRYQWYEYASTFGGNFAYFEISGATSSTFNAVNVKTLNIIPIVWASNASGESNTGFSLSNTNGTRPSGNIGSISAATTKQVFYKSPVISSFSVTGGNGSAAYSYSVAGDDPTITLNISYSGQATGSFTPGFNTSPRTGLAAGTYTFVLTATNSAAGGSYFVTSTVANVIVTAPLAAPINTVAPAVTPVTGTAGTTTYTSTAGTWTGNPTPTFEYQWQYNDQGSLFVAIAGETSSTYSPPITYFATKVSPIRCRVTAKNSENLTGVQAFSNQVTITAGTVRVTYDGNGITSPAAVDVTYGGSTVLPSSTRSGYRLAGWFTAVTGGSSVGAGGATYTPTANITLYARWIQIFTVTYDGNGSTGGSVPTDSSSPYDTGGTVTVKTNSGSLVKTGATFNGWNTLANGTGTAYAADGTTTFTITANTTLYAQWTLNTYAISYSANSATSGTAPTGQTKTYGVDITLRTNTGSLARTNFTFDGWNTQTDGLGTSYAAGANYTGNAALTLYAKWVPVGPGALTVTDSTVSSFTARITLTFGTNTTKVAVGWGSTAALAASATKTDFTTTGSTSSPVGPNTPSSTHFYNATPFNGATAGTTVAGSVTTPALPNISSITIAGNSTATVTNAGVTFTAVMTRTQSVEYAIFGRDTTTSAWTAISSGTASANGTALTSAVATSTAVGTSPDQYYITMTPRSGTRTGGGTGLGTGDSGTTRSTINNPKNNLNGSITVTF